jgi:ABC-2 type transport system ATP-binding protein
MDVQVTSEADPGGHRMNQAPNSVAARLEDASLGYSAERPILTGVNLTIAARGVTRLGGPNGVGKSTLVEVLSGFLPLLAGKATVLGLAPDAEELRAQRRVVRTRPALYPFMTVRDHLAVACRARGADRAIAEARAERFGLRPWLDENASTLSSGTAKKAWHVLSSVGEAQLYVLDEPFNAVDEAGVEQMVSEIHAWGQTAAVLVVCHTVPASLAFDHEAALA